MKRIILLSVCFCLIYSCSSNKSSLEITIKYIETIEKESLKELILNYIDSEGSAKEKCMYLIIYEIINDSTNIYTLERSLNIHDLIYPPLPILFFNVEKHLVCFVVKKLDGFKINDDFIIYVMKTYFPYQYDYYLKNDDYPPPITGGSLVWELTFQNDSLIDKKEYYTQ